MHWIERLVMCVVAVALTLTSLVHKLSCTTAVTNPDGTSESTVTRITRWGCSSDTVGLFANRHLAEHLFPYVSGSYTSDPPAVHGGTLEYPTLTGLWVWLSALPVSSVHGFMIVTALTFVPVVVVITLGLQRLAGRRAWIWAATPPLLLYALYNWDVLPVLMTVLGLLTACNGSRRWSPTTAAVLAGAAFGIGGAFKLYPIMFVVPLALAYLLDRGVIPRAIRWVRASAAVGTAVAALLAANVPFMLINFDGWASVFRFQAARSIDSTTLSVWYWGTLPWSNTAGPRFQHLLGLAATSATAVTIIVTLVVGVIIARRTGRMPWVQTSAAMLCMYMLCNKVDSLQYVLWLLPFFAVLRIRLGWVVAYLVADLAAFVGWFRWNFYTSIGNLEATWAQQALAVGVWGRAGLLIALWFAFFAAPVASATSMPAPTRDPEEDTAAGRRLASASDDQDERHDENAVSVGHALQQSQPPGGSVSMES